MTEQWVNNESENTLMCRLLVQVLLSKDVVPLHQHQNTNVLLLTLGYIVIWRYHLALFIILVVIFKQKVELKQVKKLKLHVSFKGTVHVLTLGPSSKM